MPTGDDLLAIHGDGRGVVCAVGDRGTIVRSADRGASWAASAIEVQAQLFARDLTELTPAELAPAELTPAEREPADCELAQRDLAELAAAEQQHAIE